MKFQHTHYHKTYPDNLITVTNTQLGLSSNRFFSLVLFTEVFDDLIVATKLIIVQ